jgi:hypothetical protein
MTGKQVVPAEVMIDKVKAAVAARQDPDLVLIARTDAAAVEGIDAAIDRALRYREAGADMLFLDALSSQEDIEKAARLSRHDVPSLRPDAGGRKRLRGRRGSCYFCYPGRSPSSRVVPRPTGASGGWRDSWDGLRQAEGGD